MKNKKVVLILMLALAFSLAGCTDKNKTSNDGGGGGSAAPVVAATEAAPTEEEPSDPNRIKDENGFVRDKRGYIMEYEGEGGSIEIPSSIKDVAIVAIGINAFAGNQDITEIKLPGSVELIDGSAFEECKKLERVEFAEGLLEISNDAFNSCTSLTDVKLPDSCTFVAMDAFHGAGKGSFTGSKAEYGDRCFAASTFDSLSFPEGADVSALEIFREAAAEKIELPSDLKALGESAFSKCSNIQEIILPDSVETLGEYCFAGIKILPKLKLPEGIEELPANMTSGTALDVLMIPESVKKICTGAVYDASLVVISNPETEIEMSGISGGYIYIKNAKDFVFPTMEDDDSAIVAEDVYLDQVYDPSDIQGNFYSSVTAGSHVLLPADATPEQSDELDKWLLSIGYEEIAWISGIPEDFIPESTLDFDMDGESITGYHGASDTVTIPKYVKYDDGGFWFNVPTVYLAEDAFKGTGVKSIFLTGGINYLNGALNGCDSLKDIWFTNSLPSECADDYFAEGCFSGVPEDVTIHLPETIDKEGAKEALKFVGIPEEAEITYYSCRSSE